VGTKKFVIVPSNGSASMPNRFGKHRMGLDCLSNVGGPHFDHERRIGDGMTPMRARPIG
jgi:hypothetical protein